MQLEFYWDEAGDPRARAAAAPPAGTAARGAASLTAAGGPSAGAARAAAARPERVARYLESDIQGNAGQAGEIVHAIDRVLAGRLPRWSETGNAHTLTLSPRGAAITAELEPAARLVRVPLADLRQVVAAWQAFLDRGRPAAGGRGSESSGAPPAAG
jgi:hypothetical protein